MITYAKKERARYLPVSKKLMAQYKDGSHSRSDPWNNLYWHQNGSIHRDGDKPAFISAVGRLIWYQNGSIHRDSDKASYISADGYLNWMQNGHWHRICGPAVINADDSLGWWIRGEDITPEVNAWLAGEEWRGTAEQIVEFQLRFV